MNIFFGKITDKIDPNQHLQGYYETQNKSMFNGIDVGDFSYIIAGGKIQLWKAREWKKNMHRLEFDIINNNLGIKTRDLVALKFFQLDTHYVIYPIRHAPHAFYKLNEIKPLTEDQLINIGTYQNENNYRKIIVVESGNYINAGSEDIQVYYNHGKLELYRPEFFNINFFKSFYDNTERIGSGRYHKDKTLTKIKNVKNFPHLFQAKELSILNLYDAYGVKYSSTEPDNDESIFDPEPLTYKPYPNLNTILYGPPGTGKTYNSVSKALEIVGIETKSLSRTELKAEFDKKVSEGQIAFTTFHQSMSYEDFIEGLKPATQEGKIYYDVKPGIFKIMCDNAKSIITKDIGVNWDGAAYYKMSIGGIDRPDIHEWCIANNIIALGWGGYNDLKKYQTYNSWKEYRDNFIKEFPSVVAESRYNIQAAYTFQKMRIGDVVIISKGNSLIDAIGVIKGDYTYDDKNEFDFCHFRKVEWIAINLNTTPERFLSKKISQMTIYEFYKDDLKLDAFVELTIPNESGPKPFVLIIDEINRGNISQIFGELITLIEKDKRLGESEALEVILPYSKEKFGVPSNLYIIGTMNTADRSVEALDTALRRRFIFEEILCNTKLLSPENYLINLWNKFTEPKLVDTTYDMERNNLMDLLGFPAELESRYHGFFTNLNFPLIKIENIEQYNFTGINLSLLLETINDRLNVLLDRDHMIGHAYFLGVKSIDDLVLSFKMQVIPLLQEYFYNDYGKLGLVLGSGFINKSTKKVEFPKNFLSQYDDSIDWDEKVVYNVTDTSTWSIEVFKSIYE